MLKTSMAWNLLTIFIAAGDISAEVLPGDVCYAGETPNVTDSLTKLPIGCCQEMTRKECAVANNGQCMFKWQTGPCDYTADVCTSSWFCTCCGSCTEVNTQ
ncbi:uncharacterized protein LOC135224768 [Macrobrachium nipponense]|uniref:uncharacterized protein LOC135224768 n=1 Tax=Macrobrachium nipponense TaxID=159736 RepID=UPI0030C88172